MKLFGKNLFKDFITIAEIGVNHEGNFNYAKKLIKLASKTGADAVKFQCYNPDKYVSSSEKERFKRIQKFSFTKNQFKRLFLYAKKNNIGFFATPITEDYVSFLSKICPVLKIASGDINFKPLIKECVKSNKPIIISTGMATVKEIQTTLKWVKNYGGKKYLKKIILLQCVSAYPTPINQANVMSMNFLKKKFKTIVGYSNHVLGDEACLAAVALGASVVEVHFTDNKKNRKFHDHALSFEPKELKDFIKKAKAIKTSLGSMNKIRQNSELPLLKIGRKGIIAKKNIKAGKILQQSDLMFARPATYFSSLEINKVLGKKIKYSLKKGEVLKRNYF